MRWSATLLGEVALLSDGVPYDVGGQKQQLLVAALALSPGQMIGIERLIDLLWGDNPPSAARRTLQSYVSKLRSSLGSGGPVFSASTRYCIDVTRADVDLLAFEDAAVVASGLIASEPRKAADRLGVLLAEWEDPLAGLRLSDEMTALFAPFHELHAQVQERHCTSLIDGGDALAAVRLLENLTRGDLTNEKLWHELARGLVTLDRRHHALDAVQRAREALRTELGIGLGPQLARYEVEILDGTTSEEVTPPPHGASPPATEVPTSNLRPEPNSFVDRPEVDQLETLLVPGTVVSLVGPGGIGKTRCALAVARRSTSGTWTDGIWFVDLTSSPDDEPGIAAAVSVAIGLGRQGGAASAQSVAKYLNSRDVLLILDNCEHVSTAVRSFLVELFSARSSVAVLATTRVRLGLATERAVALGPMSQREACELFVARAAEAGAGEFPVSDVEALGTALDRYPLALELAAARTRALSPREIIDRLDQHPMLALERVELESSPDGFATRHASLDLALDWSLTQLEPQVLATLHRLAVFGSDFDLAAVESILPLAEVSASDLLDHLGVLVEHHLVVRDHSRGRFVMLEPIRQTLLAREPLSDDMSRRYCEYFARQAQLIGAGLFGRDEAFWWTRFDDERAHLRSAIRWAATQHNVELLEAAMTSMTLIVLMGSEIGPAEWAEEALSLMDKPRREVPRTVLAATAGLASTLRLDDCHAALEALDRELTDPQLRATMYFIRVHLNPIEAHRWLGPLLDAAIEADDQVMITLAKVRGLDAEAVKVADAHGNPSMRSGARLFAYAAVPTAEQPRSLHLVDQCYQLALASNNQLAVIQAGVIRGTSLCRAGDVTRGAQFLLDSLERTLRRRQAQQVWTVIEVIAGLFVIMEREPEIAATLWSAVDATDLAPISRVLRDPERPLWVEAQLSADDLARAQATGATLDMDAAAMETRKAVERFAEV